VLEAHGPKYAFKAENFRTIKLRIYVRMCCTQVCVELCLKLLARIEYSIMLYFEELSRYFVQPKFLKYTFRSLLPLLKEVF
jgi:hypothetical protein